jgi:hypothetical protein
MNQGSCLEGMVRPFQRQFLRGQPTKLVINQRQEPFGSAGIALLDVG